ncbi:BIRC2-like protein [Mya arenaria]|uniref:BIRC2-like protein n=1 Tax=Mya arenaria TaxID=6604 RepID=A0ABY7EPR3_MYAAR|nr:BIRC2-like protein [Mya arenaria]
MVVARRKRKRREVEPGFTEGASGGPEEEENNDNGTQIRQENEKLREMQTCKICMERQVNTTLLPCGHLVSCDRCASRLAKCPICRTKIKGSVKTFMT